MDNSLNNMLCDLTQDELRALLYYEPVTGVFTWLVSRGPRAAGSVAGSLNGSGYRYIQIFGGRYRASRLAWLTMTSECPLNQIDHENLDRSDDRWENLRLATNGQNGQNRRPYGLSKYKGVCWDKRRGRWYASATLNSKSYHLGYHTTEESAAAAYAAFAREHFPEFARLV